MLGHHVVLVHGAYHQPWHFNILAEKLRAAGYAVSVPHLPSSTTSKPAGNVFLQDVEKIKITIESAAANSDSVIPLFHSYGGAPGGEAVARLSSQARKKIRRLIFLASFVLTEGQSVRPAHVRRPNFTTLNETTGIASAIDPIGAFYHDLEPALAAEASKHLLGHVEDVFYAKVETMGWKGLPCTYITCLDDRAMPPLRYKKIFEELVAREGVQGDWESVDLEGGHSPYLSKPDVCVELIRRASGSGGAKL
ncbi:unnamed protein product [Zymoseptoria tritici ST99CH_1E4]|uniref:AB hydrolase-1 domain-containing protein n=1 Tax=Zymoseptoria tritici ST99CH_1E4 TaxID=1276532 RepID=A0A2H1G3G9_ZYMTR|nr:unnamed protein product [Zymoseptoria tritici ST99CH_1E4]